MEFNRDKIKALSKMNVCAEEANLGETLLYLLDNSGKITSNCERITKIEHVDETEATTIKQLVVDYNKLIKALKSSGIME